MNTKRGNTTHLETLKLYQRWRTGDDERTFDEIGITGADIGEALSWATGLAAENKALRVERDQLAAKVDHLAKSIPCTVRQYRHNNDNSPNLFEPDQGFVVAYDRDAVDRILAETLTQSLAHIKAQAVTDAMEYAIDQVGSDASADDCVDAMCEYLEQVSEGKFPTVGSTGNTWRSIKAAEGGVPDGMIEFAKRMIAASRDGCGVDGTDIQDWALDLGLIEPYQATESCGEDCVCAQVSDFPAECYRDSALLATQQPPEYP